MLQYIKPRKEMPVVLPLEQKASVQNTIFLNRPRAFSIRKQMHYTGYKMLNGREGNGRKRQLAEIKGWYTQLFISWADYFHVMWWEEVLMRTRILRYVHDDTARASSLG